MPDTFEEVLALSSIRTQDIRDIVTDLASSSDPQQAAWGRSLRTYVDYVNKLGDSALYARRKAIEARDQAQSAVSWLEDQYYKDRYRLALIVQLLNQKPYVLTVATTNKVFREMANWMQEVNVEADVYDLHPFFMPGQAVPQADRDMTIHAEYVVVFAQEGGKIAFELMYRDREGVGAIFSGVPRFHVPVRANNPSLKTQFTKDDFDCRVRLTPDEEES